MSQRKTILTVSQITDDDTGMHSIGEIDGILQRHELKEYLLAHGELGRTNLINHFAFLQSQVIYEWRELNNQADHTACKANQLTQ